MSRGRPREYKVNAVEVLNDRAAGMTCKQCAEKYDVPEYVIWNLMQRTGNSGKWQWQPKSHAKPSGNPSKKTVASQRTKDMLEAALDERDDVCIERGLAGGYIVSIGEVTGREERDLNSALRSARRMLDQETA